RPGSRSDRDGAAVAGPHPDDLLDRDDPDLAVPDAAGLRGLDDRAAHQGDVLVLDEGLAAGPRDEVDGVLGAAVDLGVPVLAAVAAGLGDRHALDPDARERLADVAQPVGLDHCGDELHEPTFSSELTGAGAASRGGRVTARPPPRPS